MENQWKPMKCQSKIHESNRKFDEKLMNMDGNQRESVKIDENRWKLMKINGLGAGFW